MLKVGNIVVKTSIPGLKTPEPYGQWFYLVENIGSKRIKYKCIIGVSENEMRSHYVGINEFNTICHLGRRDKSIIVLEDEVELAKFILADGQLKKEN